MRRDAFRYDSFYSSPSTYGRRLYTISRSGTVVALDATDGDIQWSHGLGGWGYATPAVTASRSFLLRRLRRKPTGLPAGDRS